MAAPDPDSREFRQMRHDVDDVYILLDATKDKLDETRTAVGTVWGVQRRHGNRLEEIQQSLDLQSGRLDRMEDTQRQQGERLGRVDARLEIVDSRLGGVDSRLGGVDTRLEGVDTRLESVDVRLEGVDTRVEGVDTRLEGVDTRLGGVDTRLGRIEETQQEILTLLRGRSG